MTAGLKNYIAWSCQKLCMQRLSISQCQCKLPTTCIWLPYHCSSSLIDVGVMDCDDDEDVVVSDNAYAIENVCQLEGVTIYIPRDEKSRCSGQGWSGWGTCLQTKNALKKLDDKVRSIQEKIVVARRSPTEPAFGMKHGDVETPREGAYLRKSARPTSTAVSMVVWFFSSPWSP